MRKKILAAAIVVGSFSLASTANAALIVDLFTTPQDPLIDTTVGDGAVYSAVGAAGDTSIIGGFRELGVNLAATTLPNKVTIGVDSGYLSFSADSLARATGLVRWDGTGTAAADGTAIGDPTSFSLFADLTGYTNFQINTVFSDGDYSFSLELFTSETQWSKIILAASEINPPVFPDGVAGFVPLAAFLDCGGVASCGAGGAVNLAEVNAMQGIIDIFATRFALDLTLASIELTEVPEPATLALVGLGLLGVGATIRRRRLSKD